MEINIKNTGIKDAAILIERLSLIAQDSIENGYLSAEVYASAFELIGALATAVKQKTEAAA